MHTNVRCITKFDACSLGRRDGRGNTGTAEIGLYCVNPAESDDFKRNGINQLQSDRRCKRYAVISHSSSASINRSVSVEKGYTYRLKGTAYAYVTTLAENGTAYSAQVRY